MTNKLWPIAFVFACCLSIASAQDTGGESKAMETFLEREAANIVKAVTAQMQRPEAVNLLLEYGANPTRWDTPEARPLFGAIARMLLIPQERTETAALLLKAGRI